MEFKYFSKNGTLLPSIEATIPLSNIEYQYGFGVYETIRVTNKIPYFLKEHLERLMSSATIIGLVHSFSPQFIQNAITELLQKNEVETCNLKILLIGGGAQEDASIHILCLNPLFPDRKLYRDGVHCITYPHERLFPHAKTLNMLGSYLAYQKAKESSAYDALLLNQGGYITEGTRTNFYCIRGKTVTSPPVSDILPGVTQLVLLKVLAKHGYLFEEKTVSPSEIPTYDGAFLTSTSSKILPIRSIDLLMLKEMPRELRDLMEYFDVFVSESGGFLS